MPVEIFDSEDNMKHVKATAVFFTIKPIQKTYPFLLLEWGQSSRAGSSGIRGKLGSTFAANAHSSNYCTTFSLWSLQQHKIIAAVLPFEWINLLLKLDFLDWTVWIVLHFVIGSFNSGLFLIRTPTYLEYAYIQQTQRVTPPMLHMKISWIDLGRTTQSEKRIIND